MSYIIYKIIGNNEFAYRVTSKWDSKKKQSRRTTEYLGKVIDKKNKVFEKVRFKQHEEKIILDFGDGYVIDQFLKTTAFYPLLKILPTVLQETLCTLLYYRICHTGAMMHAKNWFDGNIIKLLYKKAEVSSQRISDALMLLGDEHIQRQFFQEYIKQFSTTQQGIIIDATSLPNQIHTPMTTWGLSGEEIDKQLRFLLVVDKKTTHPLFFRSLPGNIVDVSTVKNTVQELAQHNIKDCFIYHDAGFFSEENIKEYYINNINFLTRLPATRTLYKELIKNEAKLLENIANGIKYGKRGLFVKEKIIDLFGKKAYAYIVLDPKRKGREIERFLIENLDDKKKKNEEQEYDFINNGIMILISSFHLPKEEVVPAYYVRQTAEMLFGFSKDDLGILPLRVHNDQRLNGFLFLQFLTLILFVELKNKLGKKHTVEEMVLTLKKLKCKVYDNNILVSELTKEQRVITEKLSVLVPKTMGI